MAKDNKDPPSEMNVASQTKGAAPRKLDKSAQAAIGARLRAFYGGVESEPIPDRFVELLKQLEKKDGGGEKGG